MLKLKINPRLIFLSIGLNTYLKIYIINLYVYSFTLLFAKAEVEVNTKSNFKKIKKTKISALK